jgi:hypothetical protein
MFAHSHVYSRRILLFVPLLPAAGLISNRLEGSRFLIDSL